MSSLPSNKNVASFSLIWHIPLSNWNFVVKCSILMEYPTICTCANPTAITGCPNYQLPSRHNFQSQIPLKVYQNDSIGRNSNLETPHRRNSIFWKTKPDLLRQFKSVRYKLTIKERFWLLFTRTKTRGIMSWEKVSNSQSRVSLRNTEQQISIQLDS